MNQANIVNYKILVLPIDTIAQYFSSHANSCLAREGWNRGIDMGSSILKESKDIVVIPIMLQQITIEDIYTTVPTSSKTLGNT